MVNSMWFDKRRLFSKNSFPGREVEPEDILMDALNPGDFDADQMEGRIESALGKYPFIIAFAAAAIGIAALVFRPQKRADEKTPAELEGGVKRGRTPEAAGAAPGVSRGFDSAFKNIRG